MPSVGPTGTGGPRRRPERAEEFVDDRRHAAGREAGTGTHADELEEAAAVERVVVGLDTGQMGERIAGGDVCVEHAGLLRRPGARGRS